MPNMLLLLTSYSKQPLLSSVPPYDTTRPLNASKETDRKGV